MPGTPTVYSAEKMRAAYGGYCQMARELDENPKTFSMFRYEDMQAVRTRYKRRTASNEITDMVDRKREAVRLFRERKLVEKVEAERDESYVAVFRKWGDKMRSLGFEGHPYFRALAMLFEHQEQRELATIESNDIDRRYVSSTLLTILVFRKLDPETYKLRLIENPVHHRPDGTKVELETQEAAEMYPGKTWNDRVELMESISNDVPSRIAGEIERKLSEKRQATGGALPTLWVYMLPERVRLLDNKNAMVCRYTFRYFVK